MKLACLTCLSLLLLASPALADTAPVCAGRDLTLDPSVKPDFAAHPDEAINGEGLLWKIEKPGLAPSYLYGTMHSTNAAAIALAQRAAVEIDGAKSVATELGGPFDSARKLDLGAGMLKAALSPGEDTFARMMSKTDAEAVDAFLATRGFPSQMTHHLKLWFVAASIGLPKCEVEGERLGLTEVDQMIAQIGRDHGLPVVGLETIEEQTKTLASVPDALAAELLVASAKAPNLNDDGYATLLSLYLQKRPSAAIAVLDAVPGLTKEQRDAEVEFTRLLLVGRNEIMMARAAPLLDKGGAFIAVGAFHLTGKNGLIELARAAGYRVTKVW
jgi:uncharacterized protein YbaP (TraB family)